MKIAIRGLTLAALSLASPALSQTPGVTDTELSLGTILPLSGPASSYSAFGTTAIAYFDKVNDEGGINGRRVKVISYDDGYSPPRTVEQARKLIESDEVLLLYCTFGTPTNVAIMRYVNAKKVPQLFVATGGTVFGDHKKNPWTMGFRPSYQTEGQVFANYILKTKPDAKIAVLFQNDDYGRDHLIGLRAGLGELAPKMLVAEASYETSQPTVDSQIVNLRSSGADVLMLFSSNKFSAQALRKAAEIGWNPQRFLAGASSSVAAVMTAAGLSNVQDVISAAFSKDPDDPQWESDAGVVRWRAFMTKYYPKGDQHDLNTVSGYMYAELLAQILQKVGRNVARSDVMAAAENLKNVELDMLLPGIRINTSRTDHYPIEQMQLVRFTGSRWVLFGDIIDGGRIVIAD
ncbi:MULTISPECIES: ABC transporter substrate-binding protein [unclassified Bradyrhizobium]|uniref:ABC transporter substrate-binding protein n=1 Tax=unclassified Bradyrhizobium TaxID=2631580 RepID=UPI002306CF2B|nr:MULTISPECIES: ABC transporter substrate-binding protein [unclassified Bradyrhizobium]